MDLGSDVSNRISDLIWNGPNNKNEMNLFLFKENQSVCDSCKKVIINCPDIWSWKARHMMPPHQGQDWL